MLTNAHLVCLDHSDSKLEILAFVELGISIKQPVSAHNVPTNVIHVLDLLLTA